MQKDTIDDLTVAHFARMELSIQMMERERAQLAEQIHDLEVLRAEHGSQRAAALEVLDELACIKSGKAASKALKDRALKVCEEIRGNAQST
jgi:hypothetical protein